jgi:hypothetical protein
VNAVMNLQVLAPQSWLVSWYFHTDHCLYVLHVKEWKY